MKIHELKCWPEFFGPVRAGVKTFEVRKHDRMFSVGDVLRLLEWDPRTKSYTRQMEDVRVTYLLAGGEFGIERGYCVMGISQLRPDRPRAPAPPLVLADPGPFPFRAECANPFPQP